MLQKQKQFRCNSRLIVLLFGVFTFISCASDPSSEKRSSRVSYTFDKRITNQASLDLLLSSLMHLDSVDQNQANELINTNRDILRIRDTMARSLHPEKLAYIHFYGLEDTLMSIQLLNTDHIVDGPLSKAFLINSGNVKNLEERIQFSDDILEYIEYASMSTHSDSVIHAYLYYTVARHYIKLKDAKTAQGLLINLLELEGLWYKGGLFQKDISEQFFEISALDEGYERTLEYVKQHVGTYWSAYLNDEDYRTLAATYVKVYRIRNTCLEEFVEIMPEPVGRQQNYLFHFCSAYICNNNRDYKSTVEGYLRASEYATDRQKMTLNLSLAYAYLMLDKSRISAKYFFQYFRSLPEEQRPKTVLDVKAHHLYTASMADAFGLTGHCYFRTYEKTKNTAFLDTSIWIFDIMAESMEELILHADQNEQKIWRAYYNTWLSFGLNPAVEKFILSPNEQNQQRFQNYMELSKSNTHSSVQALRDCQEYGIDKDICELEASLFRRKNIEKMDSRNFKILKQRDSLKAIIKKEYPKYYKRRFAYAENDWQQLDAILRQEEIKLIQFNWFISEHTYSKAIYSVFRDGDTLIVKHLENVDEIATAISMLSQINSHATGEITRYSDSLYTWLLKPYEHLLNEGARVVIIPDKNLNNVPFELLKGDFGKLNFEESPLFTYNFSYAYTCKSFIDQYENKRTFQGDDSYLGFAYSGNIKKSGTVFRKGADELPYTFPEVQAVDNILNFKKTKIYSNINCTKENFIKQSGEYSIIHLATHGVVDYNEPENNCLIFKSDGGLDSLFSKEIEKLDLNNSKLVILSACETSAGVYAATDGLLSLSNSFAIAGVPTVISSSWAVPDEPTYQIMKSFAENYKETNDVSLSLNTAKREYLKNCKTREEKMPVNWAGLKCIGIPK